MRSSQVAHGRAHVRWLEANKKRPSVLTRTKERRRASRGTTSICRRVLFAYAAAGRADTLSIPTGRCYAADSGIRVNGRTRADLLSAPIWRRVPRQMLRATFDGFSLWGLSPWWHVTTGPCISVSAPAAYSSRSGLQLLAAPFTICATSRACQSRVNQVVSRVARLGYRRKRVAHVRTGAASRETMTRARQVEAVFSYAAYWRVDRVCQAHVDKPGAGQLQSPRNALGSGAFRLRCCFYLQSTTHFASLPRLPS